MSRQPRSARPDGRSSIAEAAPGQALDLRRLDLSGYRTALVDVSLLRDVFPLRVGGVNAEHLSVLAGVSEPLPPIVVHGPTMTVVDGAHRLEVARGQGRAQVEAILVEGDLGDAFVLAVVLNTRHGLPLSRADRQVAVMRILAVHPDWSDRRVAAVAGVSPKTVGMVRRRASEEIPQSQKRIGLDGRERRVEDVRERRVDDGRERRVDGRERRADAVDRRRGPGHGFDRRRDSREQPETGLPARIAPVAWLPTVNGNGNGNGGRRSASPPGPAPGQPGAPVASDAEMVRAIETLRRDPSLRGSEPGRVLLRLLLSQPRALASLEEIALATPVHQRRPLVQLAHQCARDWSRLAALIGGVVTTSGLPGGARRPR